jgi:hypothetical protein
MYQLRCRLVDELSEKALTFGLLDPPGVHLSECMINMETSLPEAYPDGWWDLVVEVRVRHTLCGCGKCVVEWLCDLQQDRMSA